MAKTRLTKEGLIVEAPKGKELKGDLERIATQKAEGYCALLFLRGIVFFRIEVRMD